MAIYSGFSHYKLAIFHCYVSSPEGTNHMFFLSSCRPHGWRFAVFRVLLQEHHGLVVFPGGHRGHLDLRDLRESPGCLGKYHGEQKGGEYMAEQDKKHEVISIYMESLTKPILNRSQMYIYASWWEVILTEVPTLQTCLFNQGKSMIHPRTSPFEWQRFRVSTPSKAHNLRKISEKGCNFPLNMGVSDWTS